MSDLQHKRRYHLRRRAERQDETRQRIVAATVALHQEVGPAATTISAIAERAGVERLTVYRHFPDERELFAACQASHLAAHPRPDPGVWTAVTDPEERVRLALRAFYAHYRETEAMTANVLRDAPAMPALAALLHGRASDSQALSERLASAYPAPPGGDLGRERLRAVIGHALDFQTWRSLVRDQGLAEPEAVELMVSLARLATEASPANPAD